MEFQKPCSREELNRNERVASVIKGRSHINESNKKKEGKPST